MRVSSVTASPGVRRPLHTLDVAEGSRLLVPGDVHFPVHDERVLGVMIESARVLGVTDVLLPGDTFDYWGLSGYRKDAARYWEEGRLTEEAEAGRPWLEALRELVAPGRAIIGPGNHEDRWYDLVDDNPALHGLEWWHPVADVLSGWERLPRGWRVRAGALTIEHGDQLVGSLAKHSASTVLGNYPGQNTLYGHTHRVDSCTRPTEKNGELVAHGAWTVGHTSDPRKNGGFIPGGHRWEQGWAVVDIFPLGRDLGFNVNQARVLRDGRGRPVVNLLGRTWRG
jgi:hypothetical protein